MRDQLFFFLNGQKVQIGGRDALAMLAPTLRRRGLTGTKIACAHGACGSCSVLLGRPTGNEITYQTVNACILPVFACDGAHIISVEGLNGPNHVGGQDDGTLSRVQRAMVECHGAQCGFCTPGMVVALTAFHQKNRSQTPNLRDEVQSALEGNLCRCTGYTPIIDAALSVSQNSVTENGVENSDFPLLAALYPAAFLCDELLHEVENDVEIHVSADELESEQHLFSPRTLEAAARWKAAHPAAVVVAGATEIGVRISVQNFAPREILSLARVEGGDEVEIDIENGALVLGARATWTQIMQQIGGIAPEFAAFLTRWGSPQLRNAGTVAGSIMGASPISDSLPFLLICDAELEFFTESGARRVKIADFLSADSKTRSNGLLRRVLVPLPVPHQRLRLFKVSKRRAFDRSIVSAAFLITVRDGCIENIKISCGGVAPTALRLTQTETFLRGKTLEAATWREAGKIAQSEISPVSDAAASRDYRVQLVAGLLRKFGSELPSDF